MFNTDFIIMREDTEISGRTRLVFWGGRGGWTDYHEDAHVYRTRELAKAAVRRQQRNDRPSFRDATVCIMDKEPSAAPIRQQSGVT